VLTGVEPQRTRAAFQARSFHSALSLQVLFDPALPKSYPIWFASPYSSTTRQLTPLSAERLLSCPAAGIGFHDARIDCELFALDEPRIHARLRPPPRTIAERCCSDKSGRGD
jgi:hypothetical protein